MQDKSRPANAAFTKVRLSPPARRLVVIASVTMAILSLLLWIEGGFDRGFVLAHNPIRESPAVVALCRAFSRFGMCVLCLLLVASIAASYRLEAFREARPVLVVTLFSFAAATLAATLLKDFWDGRARSPSLRASSTRWRGTAARHFRPDTPRRASPWGCRWY